MPPSAGPAITAVWKAEEAQPMALGRRSIGTRKGSSDEPAGPEKPRAAPNSASTR